MDTVTLTLITLCTFSLLGGTSTETRALICLSSLWRVSGCLFVGDFFTICSTYDTGLNAKLKAAGSSTTVVAFIIMPAATHGFTVEALKGQAVMKQLRDSVTDIQNEIGKKIFEAAAR